MKKVTAIVQARLGSSRLPGKVLEPVAGHPLLWYVVKRVQSAKRVDEVVVATTTDPGDDPIEAFCRAEGIACRRGCVEDVLDRYREVARAVQAVVVVRITADCPLIDPAVVDTVITRFLAGDADYVSNTHPPTYPDGQDVEVFSFAVLERAWREAVKPSDREHVTAYIRSNPASFRLANVTCDRDLSALRWTVDERRDLEFLRQLMEVAGEPFPSMERVLELLATHPRLGAINDGIRRNEGYAKSLEDDRKAQPSEPGGRGQALYRRAKQRIPGGTQLLSKRPEMFLPEEWPAYFSRARGVEVWDLDGRRYTDMTHLAVGACIFGVGDPDVDAAVQAALASGTMCTLNCPEEVELADLLCELHPWAQMARFARCGGEAMCMAVRIARAATGRDKVAFCGYHGWHDWYLATNLADDKGLDGHLLPGLDPAGVPRALAGSAIPFRYNRPSDLAEVVARHGHELAAIILEPVRNDDPSPEFLAGVRDHARACGAAIIADEVSAGFRLCCGGAHLHYGLEPDLAVFSKALGNGYPIAAVIGRREVMSAAQRTFISSTYWTERIGPAAAIAMIRKHRERRAHEHLIRLGRKMQALWSKTAGSHGLQVDVGGIPPLSHFAFVHPQGQAMRTYLTQAMLERGYLACHTFYPTLAHTDAHLEAFGVVLDEVFGRVAAAVADGSLTRRLKGGPAHSGFQRLN